MFFHKKDLKSWKGWYVSTLALTSCLLWVSDKTHTFFLLFKLWKKMYVPDYGHIYDLSYLKQISGKYCKIQHLFHASYLKYLGAQLMIHFQKEFQNYLEFVSGGGHHCYCWVCFLVLYGNIGCGVSNLGMTETN